MDNAAFVTLTRQAGLLREFQAVAHNIANVSTAGFRREGIVFAEHVRALGPGQPSLSMASADVRHANLEQGALRHTGGTFDFAIRGAGFFMLETPGGDRLTRAGAFTPDDAGELVTAQGYRLLDIGGAPVFAPPDAGAITLAPDGTLSADGQPIAQVGVFVPAEPTALVREAGTLFRAEGGFVPVEDFALDQGFLEESNVDPVSEVARMIAVQRAYELGQQFLDREDERVRAVIRTLGQ
jgi:flagellar basal-body rod protein FlgF